MVEDFLVVFFMLGGIIWSLFRWSRRQDVQAERQRIAQEQDSRAEAAEEDRKFHPGAALVCLGCGTHFPSPLTDLGCPSCHLSTLVLTETQYAQTHDESFK